MNMVKRMIGFFVVAALMLGFAAEKQDSFIPIQGFTKMVLVTENPLDDNLNFIKNGNDYYYLFENAPDAINLADAKGLVFYYHSSFDLDYFKKQMSYLTRGGDVGGYECYYGYNASYGDFRLIDGRKINAQLVFNGEEWLLGYPLILTGY